ncbi:MAG: type II toxin-antitoxin system VapC family toxin [Stellaceae bacterium]
MKITADTNILIRAAVMDDPEQAELAARLLREAEITAVTLPALCEFVWVLRRGYGFTAAEIAEALRRLIDSATVSVERPPVGAGLALLEAGGDFADGVIVFEGRRLGGTVFASFDRKAVALIAAAGGETHLLGAPAT